jgi:hypothetical protein
VFALVRLEPPILLRRCCDRANRRGTKGYGFWGRTDTRRAAAYTSYNRDFAAGRGALSGARSALQRTGGAGRAERRQDVGFGLPHSRNGEDAPAIARNVLIELALSDCELFHDPDGECYASFAIRSAQIDAESRGLPYLNRPSFCGEILCCWRPRWIPGSEGSPMHAYAW